MAKMLIGGELVDSVSKDTYEVRNPATGAVVDTVPKGNEKDVLQAIQAAETAFKEWSDVTAEDRKIQRVERDLRVQKRTSTVYRFAPGGSRTTPFSKSQSR